MTPQVFTLFITTIVCELMLVVRTAIGGDDSQNYLTVNLFLAWIPYVFSRILVHVGHAKKPNKTVLWVGGLLWLLFFPNAPYIITDFVHLVLSPPVPLWFDTMLLSAFAFHGVVLGVASLQSMQRLVKKFYGKTAATVFLRTTVLLTSFGIYLGRVLRWNSWDLFTNPVGVINYLAHIGTHPHRFSNAGLFIVGFSLFLFVSYRIVSPLLNTKTNTD